MNINICETILKFMNENIFIVFWCDTYHYPYKIELKEVFHTEELAKNYIDQEMLNMILDSISSYEEMYHCRLYNGYMGYMMAHTTFYQELIDKYQMKFADHDIKHKMITQLNIEDQKNLLNEYKNYFAKRLIVPIGEFNMVKKMIKYTI